MPLYYGVEFDLTPAEVAQMVRERAAAVKDITGRGTAGCRSHQAGKTCGPLPSRDADGRSRGRGSLEARRCRKAAVSAVRDAATHHYGTAQGDPTLRALVADALTSDTQLPWSADDVQLACGPDPRWLLTSGSPARTAQLRGAAEVPRLVGTQQRRGRAATLKTETGVHLLSSGGRKWVPPKSSVNPVQPSVPLEGHIKWEQSAPIDPRGKYEKHA